MEKASLGYREAFFNNGPGPRATYTHSIHMMCKALWRGRISPSAGVFNHKPESSDRQDVISAYKPTSSRLNGAGYPMA